jgi:hypothetical protein
MVKFSPPDALPFIRGLVHSPQIERRTSERFPLSIQLRTTPLDDAHRPTGPETIMVSRDISSGGMALYYHQNVAAKFLALEPVTGRPDKIQLVLEVLRCRELAPWLFEIAGKFVPWRDG